MAGNIIPAIATTNAVIAGVIVMEALRILDGRIAQCKTVHLHFVFLFYFESQGDRILTSWRLISMLFNAGELIVSNYKQYQLTTDCRTFQPQRRLLAAYEMYVFNGYCYVIAHNQFACIDEDELY